jgi:hypothetical protein
MRDFLRSSVARVWLPVLGLTAGRAYLDRGTDPGDLVYFLHKGEHLLSAGWASTFSDPMLQSGPIQLVLFGAVGNLTALAFVVELAVAALLLYVLGKVQVGDRTRLIVGVLAVAAGLTQGAFIDGHPAEAIVPLLWALAGLSAREDRVVRAGLLIGLSAGFELWGVMGAVLLLLAPRLKRAFVGGLVEAGVVIAMLAPFALAGSFRMFDHEWRVATGTILGLVVAPGTHFGWPLRLLQSALALAVGAAIAIRLRRSMHALWLAPLGVVVIRLVLDPLAFGWYFLEPEALVLVGAALLLRELPHRFPQARLSSIVSQPRPETARRGGPGLVP